MKPTLDLRAALASLHAHMASSLQATFDLQTSLARQALDMQTAFFATREPMAPETVLTAGKLVLESQRDALTAWAKIQGDVAAKSAKLFAA